MCIENITEVRCPQGLRPADFLRQRFAYLQGHDLAVLGYINYEQMECISQIRHDRRYAKAQMQGRYTERNKYISESARAKKQSDSHNNKDIFVS